jgi:hypothetical protein
MRKNIGVMGAGMAGVAIVAAAAVAVTPAISFERQTAIKTYQYRRQTPLGNPLPRKKKYYKSAKIEMTPMKQIRASQKAKRIKAQRKKDRN